MNSKLEIRRLDNEDVITTSCKSVYGVAYMFYRNSNYFQNIYENDGSLKYGYGDAQKPEGFDGDGWYHVDAYGNIIEKCPHSSDDEAVKEAHNITVGS